LNFYFDACATGGGALDYKNNPASEQRFHAVPVLETAKKAASEGTKWRLEFKTAGSGAVG
jgi:hypothetical protein